MSRRTLESNPRVCFVHGSLGRGGAEVLRLSILEEMLHRGFEVEIVELRSAGVLGAEVERLGVPLTTLGNRGGLADLSGVWRLAKWLRQKQFDVIQSSQFVTNLHTRLACRKAKVNCHIIEEHGIYRWKKSWHRWLDRTFNATADGVVACSRKVAESAASDLRLPVEQIEVVHNCVGQQHLVSIDPEWMDSPGRAELRQSLTRRSTPPVHLTGIVGTLRWEKGHSFLLEAWQQLVAQQVVTPDHHLLIVGDGPLRTSLEKQTEPISNVHFLGSVEHPRKVLSALDLFVLPSINEGFGIAIIEAMAAQVPVIATTSGGIPEVITPESGILVSPKDPAELSGAIRKCLTGEVDTLAMAIAGRRRVETQFTPTVYVDRLEEIYRQLMR